MSSHNNIFVRILGSKPVLFIELAIVLFFGFNLGKEILKKQAIENEIQKLEQDLSKLDSEKSELTDLLNYIQTDSFIESEAKEKFNLAKQGESLLVIPEIDVSDKSIATTKKEDQESDKVIAQNKSNVQKWWEYFFDRNEYWLD